MSPPPVKEDSRPDADDARDAPESPADSGAAMEKREAAQNREETEGAEKMEGVEGVKGAEGAEESLGRKDMLRLIAQGMVNGVVMVTITQGFSGLYFEEPKATLVGLTIALICCLVLMLAAGPLARFIVYYRFIMRVARENKSGSDWAGKWMHEIVTHTLTIFITLLLLSLSRLFV